MKDTVLLHIDEEGSVQLFVAAGENVDVLWVDERSPNDRVYRSSERCSGEKIAEIIGDDVMGDYTDGRCSAIESYIRGKPQ